MKIYTILVMIYMHMYSIMTFPRAVRNFENLIEYPGAIGSAL